MKKGFLSVIAISLLCCACLRKGHGEMIDGNDTTEISETDVDETLQRLADSLLSTMTLEQKVGQLFMPAVYSSADDYTLRRVRDYASRYQVGGIMLLKGDVESAAALSDTLTAYSDIEPFVSIDAEWGLAMRLRDAPSFLRNPRLSKLADNEIMRDYGGEIARECRLIGINMVLGPVLDVSSPGSVMRGRSLGTDPFRVAEMGVEYASALEEGGIISVAKHFPGHGSLMEDSHKVLPVLYKDRAELDSVDLLPFRKYINAGLGGVMTGYLAVPVYGDGMTPSALSSRITTGLLRDSLGFKGLILTDALNMAGARGYNAFDAFKAGADIILAPADTHGEMENLLNMLAGSDSIMMKSLDEKVGRILYMKIKKGIIPLTGEAERERRFFRGPSMLDSLWKMPGRLERIRKN